MTIRIVNDTINKVEQRTQYPKALDILPGISGGFARVLIGQPFDTIKTRLQVMGVGTQLAASLPPEMAYKNSMDCFRKMIKLEGFTSLYKGVMAPLCGNMILLGVHFPTFNRVRNLIVDKEQMKQGHFDFFGHWLSGASAGAMGAFISTPMELIRTKVQIQRRAKMARNVAGGVAPSVPATQMVAEEVMYKGSLDAFSKIVRKWGIRGLYQGYVSTLVRDIQGYGWFFLAYEYSTFLMAGPNGTKADLAYWQVMLAGIMAGFGLWGSMFPIDTIKSKLQADSQIRPLYKGTIDCVRQTFAKEGFWGPWRGMDAAMLRAIPVNAGIFLAVEGTRKVLLQFEDYGRKQVES